MPNYNKTLLMGHLTRDVELKHINPELCVGNFGIAVSHKFKKRDGEKCEEVAFVDCEAWGKQAEVIAQYAAKGSPLFVTGRLKLDQWKDKDGGNRSKLKLVVEDFQLLRGDGESKKPAPSKRSAPVKDEAFYEPVNEDDIPF